MIDACGLTNAILFHTIGNKNFKTSSIKDHIISLDHLRKYFEKSQDKQQFVKDSAVTIALKAMYWMAKDGIALTKFRSLLNFLKSIRVKDLEML